MLFGAEEQNSRSAFNSLLHRADLVLVVASNPWFEQFALLHLRLSLRTGDDIADKVNESFRLRSDGACTCKHGVDWVGRTRPFRQERCNESLGYGMHERNPVKPCNATTADDRFRQPH